MLETRVHLEAYADEEPYVAIEVFIDNADVTVLGDLDPRWRSDINYTTQLGSSWLRDGTSVALAVPSAAIPLATNILFNPAHPKAGYLRILRRVPFSWDPRLF